MQRRPSHKRLVWTVVAASPLAALIAIRIRVPYLVLHRLNTSLAEFSADDAVQIRHLHPTLIRMDYRFECTLGSTTAPTCVMLRASHDNDRFPPRLRRR